MELTLYISKEYGIVEGVSKFSGLPWRRATYMSSIVGESFQTLGVYVRNDKIEQLNLKAGHTYKAKVGLHASERDGNAGVFIDNRAEVYEAEEIANSHGSTGTSENN